MVAFPKVENDVVVLAERMITGLTEHPDDFPSLSPAGLKTLFDDYKLRRDNVDETASQGKIAVGLKSDSIDALISLMKKNLKQAEVDVGADTDKLSEIGWGPRQEPQPLAPPGVPTNLHPIAEGQGMLWLSWDKPASGTGGNVWNYLIERRQQAQSGGEFSEWTFAGSSYNCEINLTEQPGNVRLEYRVKSSNTAGQSMPSNSVSVVLP